jgi:hypothetical protein
MSDGFHSGNRTKYVYMIYGALQFGGNKTGNTRVDMEPYYLLLLALRLVEEQHTVLVTYVTTANIGSVLTVGY